MYTTVLIAILDQLLLKQLNGILVVSQILMYKSA